MCAFPTWPVNPWPPLTATAPLPFTIYINTLFPEEKQQERLSHELRHLEQEHFYRDELTIREVGRQSEGLTDDPVRPADTRVLPGPAPSFVAVRDGSMPSDASFGFHVPDDSLLPHFRRGEFLLCDDRPLVPGDVGLFQCRDVTMCC